MTVFKNENWIKKKLATAKRAVSGIQLQRLTGRMKSMFGKVDPILNEREAESDTKVESKAGASKLPLAKGRIQTTMSSIRQSVWPKELYAKVRLYRMQLATGAGALGIAAVVTLGGSQYVKMNTTEVFHVYLEGQEVGIVSDPQVVDDFKLAKVKEIEQKYPDVHMVLNTDEVTLKSEKAYKAESDNDGTLTKLSGMIKSHAVGVQLLIEGKPIGILKDSDTAEALFDQIKSKYTSDKPKDAGKVKVLAAAAPKELQAGESEVQKIEFVQKVELKPIDIEPNAVQEAKDLVQKLETGDVQPTKYTVEKGDCVSCIAKKFNISKQVIYKNNPWIADDMIKVGQQLDLTMLQPTLSVRTVEKVVENQEIQYETEYVQDDTVRAGITQTISSGKNGLKKVTFNVTKVNGLMMAEELLNEEIIQEPVKAKVRKGTKVIKGEGTGKFAWPVLSSSLSSGFGNRWGAFHKGVDLTSGNKSILASDNGKVVYAGFKSDYGNHIIIDHLNGYRTLYGHLSKIDTSVGKIVEKGEKIGTMGSTGDSTGVHLHFEVQKGTTPENPLKYLNR
ncbi:peptidoglycan DD-metalloendopeptidase family protein [Paenibacillus sp. MBLB4367]|uniref:peptidoglycan DD-metalloendopeptidase family protein n=1 Tax=Paenibacillus sp. MBLB4367 TaxID=3384767 RepID=UPI0039083236